MDGSLFSVQVKCFQFIGFQRDEPSSRPKLWNAFRISSIICIALCLLSEAYFVVQNFQDVMASAEAIGTLSTEITVLSKFITFYLCKEKFYQLMDEIRTLSERSVDANLLLLKRLNQFDKIVSLTYLSSGLCTGFGYCITPIIIKLMNILSIKHENDVILPMKAAFPYDISKSPAYEMTYATFCYATILTIFMSVGFDSLFFGSCLNICAHFDIIRESFDGNKEKFVKRHQKILRLTEKLNRLVKPVVFVQFLISSMMLCVIGFQVVVLESFFRRIVVIAFGLTIAIQLFIYAYGGQLIKDKSSAVADLIYRLDEDFIIIIARSQRACVIKAGFYEANLSTFTSILSSAASLITLLRSFID